MKINIGILQMDTALGRPEENRAKLPELLEKVAGQVQLAALPETWNVGFYPENVAKLADEGGEPTNSLVKKLAQKHGIGVFSGSIAEREGEDLFNTSYVFGREGATIGRYRKVHLFTHGKEHHYFTAGSQLSTFTVDGIKMGHIICYDLRFPELARSLALAGTRVLLVPAQWPGARLAHWRALLRARAIENQFYVIGINSCGKMWGGRRAVGHSLVVDPWGEVLAEGGEEEETFVVELDLERVDEVRREFTIFSDRRPEVYSLGKETQGAEFILV